MNISFQFGLSFVVGHKNQTTACIDIWTEEVFIQKLNYIHNNPVGHPWNLVQHPEDYKYSSAKFYETGIDEFELVTHYKE